MTSTLTNSINPVNPVNPTNKASNKGFISLQVWAEQNNITVQDAVILCKKRKINVTRIGGTRFASITKLDTEFYNEINAQNSKKETTRINAVGRNQRKTDAVTILDILNGLGYKDDQEIQKAMRLIPPKPANLSQYPTP
ncbi:MAG: hypothetical protein JO131_03235 [Gammaproteobacteria bacterium]|nr:hypothetical protein [Gammaproteobacteria bacterium]